MQDLNQVEILLVEDNPLDVELTLRAFRKHNLEDKVYVVEDGLEAVNFLFAKDEYAERDEKNVPKLVLLDLNLPKIDGLDVLKKMRTYKNTMYIPVVVLTSSSDDENHIESFKLGVYKYIEKPVDFDKLVRIVNELGL